MVLGMRLTFMNKKIFDHDLTHYFSRSPILGCQLIWLKITTMYPEVEESPSSGQHQRPCTIGSTPLPVMSGAMAACSMRFGVLDKSHLEQQRIER